MGGSVGIAVGFEFQEQFNAIFVDDSTREAELLFRTDRSARRSFVEFIKSGTWADMLGDFERASRDCRDTYSVWKKFGYTDPFC